MKKKASGDALVVFPTDLGWMAVVGRGTAVRRLVFGYATPDEAVAALDEVDLAATRVSRWHPQLVARLRAYARRGGEDFRDVKVELGPRTLFQRRVIAACRRIKCGSTSTYALLAAAAGSPGAARAAGSVMATNKISLIVPCHRVLGARGRLGGYSHPLGLDIKTRLLKLEAASGARGSGRKAR